VQCEQESLQSSSSLLSRVKHGSGSGPDHLAQQKLACQPFLQGLTVPLRKASMDVTDGKGFVFAFCLMGESLFLLLYQ
jgi:hypothetical protein